jgi:predicted HD superfamily hydrolase involved in NAD metabolism
MDREQLMDEVRRQMPERRWQHTVGVMRTSIALAERFGADPGKAELAAILHDLAKYWPVEEQVRAMREAPMPPGFGADDLLPYDAALLHAPLAAHVAESRYGVKDPEVLDAIRWHTTGRERMTLLDKVVCLADYIEPGRDFPGVERIRRLAETDLNAALVAGFDSTIAYLMEKGKKLFPLTVLARNSLLDEMATAAGEQ